MDREHVGIYRKEGATLAGQRAGQGRGIEDCVVAVQQETSPRTGGLYKYFNH